MSAPPPLLSDVTAIDDRWSREELALSSVKKKRRLKMNKHKRRKRRKLNRMKNRFK